MSPSKKAIKEAIDKLHEKSDRPAAAPMQHVGKPAAQKSSQRIRKKQGI